MLIAKRVATNGSREVLGFMDRTPVITVRDAEFTIRDRDLLSQG
jgi:hypothetical protein